jgi:hypothetical protein
MTHMPTPPSVARWLLEHALPADVRESVKGDLDEVFQRDCRRYGLPGARRRYWRQTMSFKIAGDTGVVARRILRVLENVDDALRRCGHAQRRAIAVPTRFRLKPASADRQRSRRSQNLQTVSADNDADPARWIGSARTEGAWQLAPGRSCHP